MNLRDSAFLSFDGTAIRYRRADPDSPKAVWVVVHGMGEHGGRYEELAERLFAAGFAVFLPDLRGFGRSGGARGSLRRFEDYYEDLKGLIRAVRASYPHAKLILFGHSFGGLILTSFLAESGNWPGAHLLVLSAPHYGVGFRIPTSERYLAKIGSIFFPDLARSSRVPTAYLSHDPAKRSERAADRLIHDRISARLFCEMAGRLRRASVSAANITLPVLMMQAEEERVVSNAAGSRVFQALGSPDKTLTLYPGRYHELVQETGREEVFSDILKWVSKRL